MAGAAAGLAGMVEVAGVHSQASASLIARMEGTRYEYSYSLNQIKGVRMLDEPSKS